MRLISRLIVGGFAIFAIAQAATAAARPDPSLDRLMRFFEAPIPEGDELDRLKDTLQTIYRKDWAAANALAGNLKYPLTKKIARWYYFKVPGSPAPAKEIARFARENPDWPVSDLRDRAEAVLFSQAASDASVLEFFKDAPPESSAGIVRLAIAKSGSGDQAAAHELARQAWRNELLSKDEEQALLKGLGKLLTVGDHLWRIDYLLQADRRWDSDRDRRAAAAKRLRGYLPPNEQAILDARLKVFGCNRGKKSCIGRAKTALPVLSDTPTDDWGAAFHRVQLLRYLERYEDAAQVLATVPGDAKKVANLDGWWAERRINALEALRLGKAALAYKITSNHGQLSHKQAWDSEFLSGWIALQRLKDPATALKHFIASRKAAELSSERSHADYWRGRAYDALGDTAKAAAAYSDAARDNTVFYGQLALQTLKPKSNLLNLPPARRPTEQEAQQFAEFEPMRAAVILEAAGLRDVGRLFFAHLREHLKDDYQLTLLAHYAYSKGDTSMALRAGRKGMQYGFDLAAYAYPTQAMPKFKPLRQLPEDPIFYAIARQESEFSPAAVSGAGARGVLQVMPMTAKHICNQYKIKCQTSKLTSDPGYNVSLATAYIADRHDDVNGSYILLLTSYNAGPGRTREWISEFGDPRSPGVDPVDWIERIPIDESRDYVKKVLANIQVYRALLGDPKEALRVRKDLVRARFAG